MKLEIVTRKSAVHRIFDTGITHEELNKVLNRGTGTFNITGVTSISGKPIKTSLSIRIEDIESLVLYD